MAKIRVFVFLSTLVVVGLIGLFVSYYARGYRLNLQTLRFVPNGILVLKSEPDGASVYINGELKTATNATISLSPGTYDVEIKKDGFTSWYKRLTIEKEIVTTATASLFKNAPSLSPVTFSGAKNPVVSPSGTKVAYTDSTGLWVMDTFSLPLGFTNDPKRITDGELTGATYYFSPDEKTIMLTTSNSVYLLDTASFTPQSQLVNISSKVSTTQKEWDTERQTKDQIFLRNLPPAMSDVLSRKTETFVPSPDETMVLYTASGSASIPDNLIKPLPGASTQKQVRDIKSGQTYVYDIKEDRNFLVSDQYITLSNHIFTDVSSQVLPALRWMPDSRHLLSAGNGQITVMDYDGTNNQSVYNGSYVMPYAFPFRNTTKILILTNLGSADTEPTNLYTITVK